MLKANRTNISLIILNIYSFKDYVEICEKAYNVESLTNELLCLIMECIMK